jgi:LacI family transcriptional regulator
MKQRFRVLMALTYNDPLYQQGIIEYANEVGWELDMSIAYYGKVPIHWKGDGILTHYLSGRQPVLDWVRRQKVPVVSLNADEVPYWAGSTPDHRACGLLAVEHFLSLGLQHFAYFRCSDQHSVASRQKVFTEEMTKHGGTVHLLDWRVLSTKRNPVALLGKKIGKLPKPLGIFCQSDHRAPILFNAIQENGLHVPTDVAVLGVGNHEKLCNLTSVPLSSIDTDMVGVAREAAALLDRIMRNEKPPSKPIIVPPVGVVRRRSTLAVNSGHPKVNEAMQFILSNFASPINAKVVVRHVEMSRAGLSRLFETHLGHSISEMILRIRMEQVKHELLTTDRKVYEICEEAGFSSYIHFAKAFCRHHGCTASEFRERHHQTKSSQ